MNDRIQEIKQRQAEATPGPWTNSRWAPGYVVTDDDKFDVVASVVEYRENGKIESKFCGDKSLANREFIAHAPDDIAYLLSEVERLQEEKKVMKEALEFYDSPFIKEQVRMYYFGTTHFDYIGERARTALSHLKG